MKDRSLQEAEREARREELRLKEREWDIERERMQIGSQSTRGANVQLPSDIYKVLPRMSNNDTDVLTFFRTCEHCFKATGVDRSQWHEFMPALLCMKRWNIQQLTAILLQ